ncbi:MAG: NAD-dependent malic enzyme [Nitrospira sp.]|nr:NAD-dependent malic enzyme [Candidatus Manganitrophaceae bacterium]HIL35222.1 NAD-dependent malic enzyme [Candidatus Manganitrophaceae bacterium]
MAYSGASRSITLRLRFKNKVGILGQITSVIGKVGGDIEGVDIVNADRGMVSRDITVKTRDEAHVKEIVAQIKEIPNVQLLHRSDRTFLLHLGGKIEITNKIRLKTRDDLSRLYTPGVAHVCMAIHEDKGKAFTLTIKKNSVMIVTDGSAVLGLGNIGPEAAMPVMEGKAMLFKEFGKVDAYPICLRTQDTEEIIQTVKLISTGFGGVNLEDISSPRCFEIERRLKEELDIPVFHDDQHGTAIVVLAALINAAKIVKKDFSALKVVVNGVGAAGISITDILLDSGVKKIIGCDRKGTLYAGRKTGMNKVKEDYVKRTNLHHLKGGLEEALQGADIFIGVSSGGVLKRAAIQKMARDPVIFALANPTPEIMPEEAEGVVRIMATGRSDYPNQINNVLAFPGVFRGALDIRASRINMAMKQAAAHAIASVIHDEDLSEDYIIPGVFDRKVTKAVAQEVAKAAAETGVSRSEKKKPSRNLTF